MKQNALYYGDNLVWLRDHDRLPNESIDLIYLDPPFNSNADYNIIFKEPTGEESQAQIQAFGDTWRWESDASAQALEELSTRAPDIADFIAWLGKRGNKASKSMAAYLGMMAVRLIELRRVLKLTGSIYLHCDPTAGHYLKILMDSMFGVANFRCEIVWKRTSAHSDSRSFGSAHDLILYYTKSGNFTHNTQYQPYDQTYLDTHYRNKDANGRIFRTDNLTAKGLSGGGYTYEWHGVTSLWRYPSERMKELEAQGRIRYTKSGTAEYIRYLDEMPGMPAQDVWDDIPPINSQAKERLGYPTQKPEALLERIINASSNEGDTVLDPFCGCGTALVAAHKLKRRWIGIDITYLSIDLVEKRLSDSFNKSVKETYQIFGNPYDVASSQSLWNKNAKEFELWALSLVGATPRAKDGGVDGVMGFVGKNRKVEKVVVQVKGGETLTPSIVRDLIGTVEKEDAAIGLLISLHEPTSGMTELAVHADSYKSEFWKNSYPRIQIRTIKELLVDGKGFDLPPQISTWKKSQRINPVFPTMTMF